MRGDVKSPVQENCPPGSVRGAPGNRRPYLDSLSWIEGFLAPLSTKASTKFATKLGRTAALRRA